MMIGDMLDIWLNKQQKQQYLNSCLSGLEVLKCRLWRAFPSDKKDCCGLPCVSAPRPWNDPRAEGREGLSRLDCKFYRQNPRSDHCIWVINWATNSLPHLHFIQFFSEPARLPAGLKGLKIKRVITLAPVSLTLTVLFSRCPLVKFKGPPRIS